eukprot:COSAG06_NODE_57337_length_280_cov_1.668508_1_plen_36_part_10
MDGGETYRLQHTIYGLLVPKIVGTKYKLLVPSIFST